MQMNRSLMLAFVFDRDDGWIDEQIGDRDWNKCNRLQKE